MDQYIFRIKEFYVLETFQVAYYKAQVESAENEYYAHVFDKMVKIAQGHVAFFAARIREAEETIPVITGTLFELAGSLLGETIESIGPKYTCKLGAALEKKAIKMYRTFIEEVMDNPHHSITDTLTDFLLDEEFHTLWLQDFMYKYPYRV